MEYIDLLSCPYKTLVEHQRLDKACQGIKSFLPRKLRFKHTILKKSAINTNAYGCVLPYDLKTFYLFTDLTKELDGVDLFYVILHEIGHCATLSINKKVFSMRWQASITDKQAGLIDSKFEIMADKFALSWGKKLFNVDFSKQELFHNHYTYALGRMELLIKQITGDRR